MRKHRLYGAVIAALLGAGVFLQHPQTHNKLSDAALARSSVGFASAELAFPGGDTIGHGPIVPPKLLRTDRAEARNLATFARLELPATPPPRPVPSSAPVSVSYQPPAPTHTYEATYVARRPSSAGDPWYELRMCESGDNYGEDTGNGYYGAYQFSESTWESLGYSGLPSNASPATQDQAAHELQARSGWGQWPACSARLGL
jgi:hypothetical protein